MELAGKIKVILDKQTFGSGFEKREVVVTTQEQYPQDIKFEVYKEKCAMLDNFTVNEDVTVHFNLRGNEYNGKYFVNLNAWKIDKGQGGAPVQENVVPENAAPLTTSESPFDSGNSDDDDLPF
ncbi:DUF3127 domain-containing protein [Flavobacteriales bacterium]|nr:DUF3127 domain-containing protein [Flavobacteriales bacterium]